MDEKEIVFMEERKQKIINLLSEMEKVTVSQLSELFNVSNATIRSDLRDLEHEKRLRRTHGGAIKLSRSSDEIEPHQRSEDRDNKVVIAQEALKFVDDGDTIAIDTGSTCYAFAKLLGAKKNIRVVTNDVHIVMMMDQFEGVEVYFIGGLIRKHYNCTVGNFGSASFEHLVVDKAFMGTNSFTLAKGATTPDVGQAEKKRLLIAIADKVFILSGSQKFGQNSFVTFAETAQIDVIITDSALSKIHDQELEHSGIEVILATPDTECIESNH